MSISKESDLYAKVESYAKRPKGLDCSKTWINAGNKSIRPDVSGIRHSGGVLRGDFELIAIEVKSSAKRFVTILGQASAYSAYVDRVYLCCGLDGVTFSDEEIDIAAHLGVGLLSINSRLQVKRILPAPPCTPMMRMRQEFLESLGWVSCQICSTFFPASGDPEKRSTWGLTRGTTSDIANAAEDNKGYRWWVDPPTGLKPVSDNDYIYHRRAVCPNCVRGLFRE
jgi:hypothetical protein